MIALPILLLLLVAVPMLAALIIALFFSDRENGASQVSAYVSYALPLLTLAVLGMWAAGHFHPFEADYGNLYQNGDYSFLFALRIDFPASVFLLLLAILQPIIIKYCRYYLHREPGYSRFFVTIWFFIAGMNLLVTAGTLDLLFAGWEIVGIASFLLIGFYRERTGPVRNAFKAYCVYRFCDMGLLLSAWLTHLIWHTTEKFSDLNRLVPSDLSHLGLESIFGLCLLILLAACGKSAQFPFSFWLPRAMEGPTPSSAIFYGALSIHAGVFLLIRTSPLWLAVPAARFAVASVGICSAIFATLAGRTQSNIKAQLAYASIAQVGIMFIELSLNLQTLVLFHLFAHAMLRFYQLLISPSVVAHLLRIQRYGESTAKFSDWSLERRFPPKWRSTLYAFALSEGYLEAGIQKLFLEPLAKLGALVQRGNTPLMRGVAFTLVVAAVMVRGMNLPSHERSMLAALGILMVLSSLAGLYEMSSPRRAWNSVAFSSLVAAVSIYYLHPEDVQDITVFLGGIVPSWILGRVALHFLCAGQRYFKLDHYHGLVALRPQAALIFFLAFLGMSGFPISPAFVGIDLLIDHATGGWMWLAFAITVVFVLNGIALARLCARLSLGPANPRERKSHSDIPSTP
jgi:NADH-quinone oxidoreductase subunit L